MYALINDRPFPVESLRSVIVGPRGRIMITGTSTSPTNRQEIVKALLPLHKRDMTTFNVVTSDWRSISGRARITDVKLATKEPDVRFFVIMKIVKNPGPSKEKQG